MLKLETEGEGGETKPGGAPVAAATAEAAPAPARGKALTAPISGAKWQPKVDRSRVDPNIVKAAEGMEGMFINYMMTVMRQSVPKNDMDLDSPAQEIYRGMLDTEYAQKAVHAGGVGLADTIIAYMDQRSYTQPRGNSPAPHAGPARSGAQPMTAAHTAPHPAQGTAPAANTGGTHAGQPTDE